MPRAACGGVIEGGEVVEADADKGLLGGGANKLLPTLDAPAQPLSLGMS